MSRVVWDLMRTTATVSHRFLRPHEGTRGQGFSSGNIESSVIGVGARILIEGGIGVDINGAARSVIEVGDEVITTIPGTEVHSPKVNQGTRVQIGIITIQGKRAIVSDIICHR